MEEETCELPTASKRRKLNENVDDQLSEFTSLINIEAYSVVLLVMRTLYPVAVEIPVAKIAMCQVTNTNGKLSK